MTSLAVRVRAASAADAGALADLARRTFVDAFAADNSPADMTTYLQSAFAPEIQAQEIANPASTCFLADVAGDLAGYARLLRSRAPACVSDESAIELVRLYAERRFHGKGVGNALLQHCLEEATRQGAGRMWLGVWERNARARAFYTRWGFRAVGTQDFFLGSDRQTDVVMTRVLA